MSIGWADCGSICTHGNECNNRILYGDRRMIFYENNGALFFLRYEHLLDFIQKQGMQQKNFFDVSACDLKKSRTRRQE